MKKLQAIDYILIVEVALMLIGLVYIVSRPAPACIESLDVTKGQNFNQPILTKHNCTDGQVPTNWRAFEPKGN